MIDSFIHIFPTQKFSEETEETKSAKVLCTAVS